MKEPDFFIIGAPKCGTSSLTRWLAEHPNIYMPGKEVHFFSTDFNRPGRPDARVYKQLFSGASSDHIAVGEASVWYLYSKVAVPSILDHYPNARFIVCLRNPVDMAYSLHEEVYFQDYEPIKDFETAWRVQFLPAKDRNIPERCVEPAFLEYSPACSLGAQLSRLYTHVARDRVLCVLLDDVVANTRMEYLRVLQFLGVPDDGREDFPILNSAKERASLTLLYIVRWLGFIKRKIRMKRSFGVLSRLDYMNVRPRPRDPMPDALRKELCAHFSADVHKLSNLLGRDLSSWNMP